jgi:ligand-binding sensor domain-containing protein/signal transduction histidine kinase
LPPTPTRVGIGLRPGRVARLVSRRLARAFALTFTAALALMGAGSVLRAERLPIVTYTTSDGLAHDRIRCIVPDSQGFLWLCTADGLSRFDGTRFVNYGPEHGLPHASVEDIAEAGHGVYWVATVSGLAQLRSDLRRSRDGDTVGRLAASQPQNREPALLRVYSLGSSAAANHVFTLCMDRAGRLWIGTADGLFALERAQAEPSFQRVQPDRSTGSPRLGQVRALAESRDGTLWVGTLSGLFRRLPDGRLVRDRTVPNVNATRALLVDRIGRVWIGHDSGVSVVIPLPSAAWSDTPSSFRAAPTVCRAGSGDVRLPVAPGDTCRFDTIAGLPAVVRSLSEGADGRVWIGTPGGLVEFDGARFRAYLKGHGLPNETINAVAEDRAAHVWIGADGSGVSKLVRHGVVSFREADGLRHDYVTSISQSRRGRVRAMGGWSVINEFDAEQTTWRAFGLPGFGDSAPGHAMVEDHAGHLWVGTPKGLFRFPEVASLSQLAQTRPKVYTVRNGLPAGLVAPEFEDSRGDVWMRAHLEVGRRVMRWQRSTGLFQQYPETDSQLAPLSGLAFAEDDTGTVWLGSRRGLARHRNGRFTDVALGDRSLTVGVTALHVDPRGRLWVGTRGAGLFRSDDPAASTPRFTPYTVSHGLSSGTIWCLTDDGAGHVYAGTARGVDRLDPASGRFRRFTVADGLAGSEVIAAFRDREGALWFGTFTGISRLTPRPDVPREPPTIRISGLRIRGVAHHVEHLGQVHVTVGDLEVNRNHVEIDFFGLSHDAGERLRYQYRLEGTDSTWTAPATERRANFAELGPGAYHFAVRAVNSDGQVSAQTASVAFTILKPVWQRWWFLSTSALLVLASGYAVHRYRLGRLLAVERLRTRIASDLHDDVGSSLTQIAILSEIVRAHLGHPDAQVGEPLSRIGELSRASVDSMSDIVWAIDPSRDAPIHLLQRMRRVAAELLQLHGLQLRFESSGDMSPRLSADLRRQAFLSFKEILNNIVRHAGATGVTIEVTIAPRQLRITVSDDGRGFDSSAAAEGQGLRNMRRRCGSVGGAVDVMSRQGTGTSVRLTLPVR